MPRFLIEFYGDLEGYIRKEADMIAGANTIDELIQKIEEHVNEYIRAKVYILRAETYYRLLEAYLQEWREIINEEQREKDKHSVH